MAGSSFFKNVRKAFGTLAIIIPVLALSGCGEGDGPISILNTAADPLPPGFEEPSPTLGIFSETNNDPVVIIQDIQQAGNTVLISTETVRVFEGDVSLGLTYTTGGQFFGGATILFEDADFSPYNTLKFSIDTSSFANFANLTVQLEPPGGGTAGAFVALADYVPVATEGNWKTYEIPLADLPAVNLTLVNKLGFFNARDAGDVLLAGTLYLDDIHLTVTDLGGPDATGTPIDPEVVLYATEGELDLVIPDDYDDVTGLESGSVPNLNYADDDTYGKVLSVFSGIINDTNVAQVGFIGFDPGFVTFYEDLDFKIKGMPNFVVFVTLYEGGDPVRINLTSSGYSEALGDGWYQVSIPLSSFTGLTTATGIVFESDDSAQMQFNMFLTDIGFSGTADVGGDGGDGGDGGASLGVFSETHTNPSIVITDFLSVGNPVDIDGESTAVVPFDGTDSLALTFSDNTAGNGFGGMVITFEDEDLSAYDTLKFSIDVSAFPGIENLTVQLEPPGGGTPGGNVSLADYTSVATSGNWDTFEIPLAEFTAVDPSVVNALGFFNARDGSDVLLAGTLYLDDIHFTTAGGGNGGASLGVFSETNTDPFIVITDVLSAGNPVDIDGESTAVAPYDGTDSLALTFSDNTAGNGYGGAIVTFEDEDLSAYDTLKFAIDTSAFAGFANLTVQLEPPGGGTPGGNVSLGTYVPVATSGNWEVFEIPLADFTAVDLSLVNVLGFFNARDGSDVLLAGTLYLDDIHFTAAGGGGGGGSGGGPVEGNLAVNGDFEDDFTGWAQYPSAETTQTIVVDATTSSNVARLFIPASAGGVNNVLKQERLLDNEGVFSAGDVIQISFDYRGEAGDGILFVKSICETADPVCGDKLHNEGAPFGPAGWTNYTDTFTLGAGVTGYTLEFAAVCGAGGTCTAEYFVDNVSITIQ